MNYNDYDDYIEELSYEDIYGEYFGNFPDERAYIAKRITRWLKSGKILKRLV